MSKTKLDDDIARAFYVERFDDFIALEQGASVQTSKAYKLDIARFVTYARVKGAASPTDIGAKSLREYVYHLKDLGLAPASIRRNFRCSIRARWSEPAPSDPALRVSR